jgi:hypothetical protein
MEAAANATDDPIAYMNKAKGWTDEGSDIADMKRSASSAEPAEDTADMKRGASRVVAKPAPQRRPSYTGSGGSGRGGQGGPTAEEVAAYREQQYQNAIAEAKSPEGQAKRREMEKSQALEGFYPEAALGGLGTVGIKTIAKAAQNLAQRSAAPAANTGRALAQKGFDEVTFLGKTGAKDITPVQRLAAPAKRIGQSRAEEAAPQALSAPTKRLGFDKAGAKAAERSARSEGRQAEMLKENARRSGLREDAPEATMRAVREKLGGNDFSLPMKKGGAVKKYAAGGSVSSRADGIAQRGKTRGKMC